MSASLIAIPPLLTTIIGHLAAAVPARARTTFTELLVGAATTRGVTDAILAVGLTRSWTTYYWFIEYGRWAWLAGAADDPEGAVRSRRLVCRDR
jgi:hypothetical protein